MCPIMCMKGTGTRINDYYVISMLRWAWQGRVGAIHESSLRAPTVLAMTSNKES